MEPNIGPTDKLFRIGVGFVAAFLVIFTTSWLSVLFLIITLASFTTVAFEYCPMYSVFGISTIKKQAEPKKPVEQKPTKAPARAHAKAKASRQ